jgi:hypothetical protein
MSTVTLFGGGPGLVGVETVMIRVPVKPPADAVIDAVPTATPVTTPVLAFTEAIVGWPDAHAKVAVTGVPAELRAVAVSVTLSPTFTVVVFPPTETLATVLLVLLFPPGLVGELSPPPPPHATAAARRLRVVARRIAADRGWGVRFVGITRPTPTLPSPSRLAIISLLSSHDLDLECQVNPGFA